MGMIDGCSRAGLPQKTEPVGLTYDFICRQEFYGNLAVKSGVIGKKDDTHPPFTKFFNDLVLRNSTANFDRHFITRK
jgi:hypothetical protein